MWLSLQFEKPGRRDDFDYPQMAKESGKTALILWKESNSTNIKIGSWNYMITFFCSVFCVKFIVFGNFFIIKKYYLQSYGSFVGVWTNAIKVVPVDQSFSILAQNIRWNWIRGSHTCFYRIYIFSNFDACFFFELIFIRFPLLMNISMINSTKSAKVQFWYVFLSKCSPLWVNTEN